LKITQVEAIPFAIPYRKSLHFASGHIDVADNVLVRVVTSDGIVGVAEAPPRPYTYGETQASIVAVIDSLFAPAITGLSLLAREQVRERLARTVGNPTAKSAIDMAIWDAWGKTVGRPVHELLGGYAESIRVSHMLGFDEPSAMADEAVRMRHEYGITSFKVKVGRRPIALDIAVCRAIHRAIGDSAELYIDGNRGWTASEAAVAIKEMSDLGLSRVEELCPADDVLGRRWLVQQCPVPFVADESVVTPADVTRELLSGAATAISIKTARTGFSDSLRVAHLAAGLGVEAVLGNQIDGQIGTACSLAFGASQRLLAGTAAELSNYLDMADDLLVQPLEISDGAMAVRKGPGLGIEVDVDKLDHYRLDRS
jgi:L-alanine-DL-glutamate epimerase-like enolase superfamily enzyme